MTITIYEDYVKYALAVGGKFNAVMSLGSDKKKESPFEVLSLNTLLNKLSFFYLASKRLSAFAVGLLCGVSL